LNAHELNLTSFVYSIVYSEYNPLNFC